MKLEEILELINGVSNSNLSRFEYEEGGTKIQMAIGGGELSTAFTIPMSEGVAAVGGVAGSMESPNQAPTQVIQVEESQNTSEEVVQELVGDVVEAPLVGMFYTAPSEDAKPYVQVGDKVSKGQTLAIIEAMKLMNEIVSDFEGTVLEVYQENFTRVEYGQPLFRIG